MTLVERDSLLQSLSCLLQGAAQGTGHVALVAGEAGIGKTSLVAALAGQAGAAVRWWGACDALQTPHPLAPLHDLARGPVPALRPLLDADADRSRLFEALLCALQEAGRPVLMVIEDAHWADEATIDLLLYVGRRIESVPCLMVVTYRDDELEASHPLRRLTGHLPARLVTRLELPRLSARAVEQLAREALRSPEGIHAITQGNPLFVAELLRNVVGGVPSGVQDLVLARFGRLSADAQEIVRLASLVPARIELELLRELLAPSPQALEESLNSGLLLASASGLAFRHELTRVAVELAIPPMLAASLHARILATLERENSIAVSLARRVHHAMHAGDGAAVLRLAPEAARQAEQRGAHTEAAAQWRSALAHAGALPGRERARMLDALSYQCYLTDRIEEAISARGAARALWRIEGDRLREGDALRWLSRLSWYNGQTGVATAHAEDAIALLEDLPPGRELAMAWSNRAQLCMLAGQPIPAQAWGAKAIALAQACGDREIEVHALNNVGTALLNVGEESGRELLHRSLELALASGFEEHAARAYTNLAFIATSSRDYARGADYLEPGIAYCDERDLGAWARYMGGLRAEARFGLGDWDRASELASALLREPHLAAISRVLPLVVLARIHALRGDPGSTSALDEALALALATNSLMRIGPVAVARAERAWLQGDEAGVLEAVRLADAVTSPDSYLPWIVAELEYWRRRAGAPASALPDLPTPYALEFAGRHREAAEAWAEIGSPYEQARALAQGDAEAQLAALEIFERLGARVDSERTRRRLQAAGVRGLPRGQRASTQANPHELTRREIEVLLLLCAGLRNAQIAKRLSRSVRTVDHHLAAVFAKLGVASRAEAIAAAHAAGIVPGK